MADELDRLRGINAELLRVCKTVAAHLERVKSPEMGFDLGFALTGVICELRYVIARAEGRSGG